MTTGSCLCGAVTYRIDGPLEPASHCHCTMCRKAHGAAFATYTACDPGALNWTAGEDAVVHYESSAGVERAFCAHCGSVVPSRFGEHMSVPLANLDGAPEVAIRCHIFTDDLAPWHVISDDLPCHPQWDGATARPVIERAAADGAEPGVLRGSCLCAAVTFRVTEPFTRAHNCFCSRCRKGRSAAHASNGFTSLAGCTFTRGEDEITTYKLPDARFFTMAFCRRCGSGVPRQDPQRGITVVPLGALDDDPGRGVDSNIFSTSAAPWYPARENLPCFEGPAG